jgi:MFS family permease
VYGAVQEFGLVAGPVLAAGAFMFIHPSGVLLANAITFGVSAVLLSTLPVGRTGAETAGLGRKRSLLTSALDGARALRRNRAASTVVLSSALFVCFLGTVNVTELVLVRTGLRGGAAGYAVVVAMMGVGVTAGSLIAGRRDHCATGPRLYLAGIALCAAGMAGCALAPNLGIALIAFLAMGLGNGIALVSENIILQQVIPGDIKGRVFGLKASLISSAFLVSYVGGGVLVNAIGPRATFGVIAAGSVLVLAIARTVLAVQRVQPLRTAASQASG